MLLQIARPRLPPYPALCHPYKANGVSDPSIGNEEDPNRTREDPTIGKQGPEQDPRRSEHRKQVVESVRMFETMMQ